MLNATARHLTCPTAHLQEHLPPSWRPALLPTTSASTHRSAAGERLKPVTRVPGTMPGQSRGSAASEEKRSASSDRSGSSSSLP